MPRRTDDPIDEVLAAEVARLCHALPAAVQRDAMRVGLKAAEFGYAERGRRDAAHVLDLYRGDCRRVVAHEMAETIAAGIRAEE